eukprot:153748-Amphidinium_carterae.1
MLRALFCFGLCINSVEGVLPRSSKEVQKFVLERNRLTGALPDGGLRAMLAMTAFNVNTNLLTGTLPDGGMSGFSGADK